MASTEILTYQDLTERLLDGPFGQLTRDGRNVRLAKRAVIRAMRDLPSFHKWTYYERLNKFTTVAPQTTGTIQYDHADHASGERVLLLTGTTWPTNAYLYNIIIGTATYDVSAYIDTTTIQLAPNNNPGADIAAGTSYNLYRNLYPAPVDMRRCSDPVDLARGETLTPVEPKEGIQILVGSYQPQQETHYTVRNADNYFGALVFEVIPPPNTARRYDYVYERAARPMLTEKYSTGTVTATANDTTIAGTATVFSSAHVGAIIRISANGTSEPTAPEGYLDVDNPYVGSQRSIMSVTNATTLVIDQPISASTTYTDVKYTISDPLDVEPHAMLSAAEKLAISYFAEDLGRGDEKERRRWHQIFRESLLAARISDNTMRDAGESMYDRRFFNLRDWLVQEAAGGSVIT